MRKIQILLFAESLQPTCEMDNNIQRTIFLVSICCTVVGFNAVNMKNTKTTRFVRVYCWILLILYLFSFAGFTAFKLMQFRNSFISVRYLLLGVGRITMMTYYGVLFATCKELINKVYKIIDYTDQSLQRIGVKCHARQSKCNAQRIHLQQS